MPEKPSSLQGDLFHPGYEVITPERRAADSAAYDQLMAKWAAEAEAKGRKRWEDEADYPFEVEELEFDEHGREILTPRHQRWLDRQEARRKARAEYVRPEQLTLDLRPQRDTQGSRRKG